MINPSKEDLDLLIREYFGISKDNTKGEFAIINSNSLAAISIVLIIRKKYLHLLSNIETNSVAVGFAKSLPNKGAVSVSFNLGQNRLLFINCHLEAHIQNR